MFVNLSESLNIFGGQVLDVLEDFVDSAINDTPGTTSLQQSVMATHYHNKSDEITAVLFNGTFVSPLPGINESLATSQGHLTAALWAPIINAHWQLARTIVIKASANSLDGDYCTGNNYAPSFAKFCDKEGDLWAIVPILQDPKISTYADKF
ncbi:hypothetical protein G7054_g692 [Neopestalotiopsis clavispora]|nr:hypothetical protein G7054_g692 [Neopestalotiopsis clavispora]